MKTLTPFIAALAALPWLAQGQSSSPGSNTTLTYTVATLPSASSYSGKAAIVKDGIGGTDCTVGGGSTVVICISNGTAWATGSSPGTLTNFSVAALPSIFSSSVATSTTTPALTISPATGQTPHLVYGTCGSATSFSACNLVSSDLPAVPLATGVSGILPVANGGSGTGSTLTGLVRGSPSAMTASELSGDVTTSGSNAATVVKVNGAVVPASTGVLGSNSSSQLVAATDGSVSAIRYVAGGGTAQVQTATLSPAVTSLANGLEVLFLPLAANSGGAPTLSVNGLTAKPITKLGTTALIANDLTTTAIADVIYDGTEWQLMNPQTTVAGGVVSVGFTGGLISVGTPTTTPALTIAGTSGGVPYFSSASTWASSGALAANGIVLGGGAGAAPTVTGADSTTTHALFATAGAPAFRSIAVGDIPTLNQSTTGTSSNITGIAAVANGGTGTASTLTGVMRGNSTAMTAAELSGDATTSGSNAVTVVKVNGGSVPVSAGVLGSNGSGQPIAATAGAISTTMYVTGGGTAQAQTATLVPAVGALVNGLEVRWLPLAANSGAAPTLSVNGLTAKPITKTGTSALVANDLTTTAIADAVYDGTEWQLLNPQTPTVAGVTTVANGGTGTGSTLSGLVRGNASAMTAAELSGDVTTSGSNAATVIKLNGGSVPTSSHVLGSNGSGQPIAATASDLSALTYVAGGGTAQAQTATYSPAVTLTTGLEVQWLPAAANTTAAPTLAVNGLTAKPITKFGTAALAANDLTTTAVADAIYDGTEWQLLNPQTIPTGTVTSVGWTGGLVSVATGTTTPAFTIAGTSGGVPYFSSASTWASSPVLAANGVMLGGGAGAAPSVTTADSTTAHALFATAGAPAFRAIATGDIPTLNQNTSGTAANITGIAAVANGGTGTASTLTGIVRGSASAMTAGELSGDVTTSGSNAATVVKVNGGAVPASAGVLGSNGSNQPVAASAAGVSSVSYVAGGGTAQAQTATLAPAVGALANGLEVRWLPIAANTLTAPTLAVNGLAAKPVTKFGAVALVASDLTTTAVADAIYDGTEWQLLNPQTASTSVNGTTIPSSSTLMTTSTSLVAAQMPALTGDVTNSAGSLATTVGAIGGKTVSLSGNLTTTGAFNPTFAIPSSSTWTFPAGPSTLMSTATVLASGQVPTFTGDVTASGLALTVGKIGGKTVSLSGNLTTTGAFNPTLAIPSSSTWTFPAGPSTLMSTATNVLAAQMPALTGDVTTSAGAVATSVVKVNGASVPASSACIASNGSSQLIACTAVCTYTKYTVAFNDGSVAVASATPTKTLATLGSTSVRICGLEISGTTAFTGIANLTGATVRLQSSAGTPILYSPNQDIFGTVGPTTNNYWSDAGNTVDRSALGVVAAFTFTCSSGTCLGSGLSAGSVNITVGTLTMP